MLPEPRLDDAVRPFVAALRAGRRAMAAAALAESAAVGAAAALAATSGIAVASLTTGSAWFASGTGVAIVIAIGAGAAWAWHRRGSTTPDAVAREIERLVPDAMNVVVTAEALVGNRLATSTDLALRIVAQAAVIADRAHPVTLRRRQLARACIATALAATATLVVVAQWRPGGPEALAGVPTSPPADTAAAGVGDLHVTVVPPPYVDGQPRLLVNPERLDILEGSRLDLASAGSTRLLAVFVNGAAVPIDGAATATSVRPVGDGSLSVDMQRGSARDRRTIPLVVSADPVPSVTIVSPGRDLLVDDVTGSLSIAVAASDDRALTSLRLRYTRVSGSGEQFDFSEGDVPVTVTPSSASSWAGRARLDLSSHALAPGDFIAYRAVARDRRPGAGDGVSDTFVVRVAQPGDVASAGFAIDEDENKFALSQQMLLIKTQRLHAERTRLSNDEVSARAAGLAVEQRMIRNEFSFMVGGEVEDEEEEAAHSHELQEGRDDNRGRREVLSAIRAMSRAEQWLLRGNSAEALPQEREAVEALQKAFSRTRYLLRTLPIRARIDLERRLSGDTAGSRSSTRPAPPATARERVAALLRVLGDLDQAARTPPQAGSSAPGQGLIDLADRIAAIDPRSRALAEAARLVLDARRSPATASASLASAAAILAGDVRQHTAAPIDLRSVVEPQPPAPSNVLQRPEPPQ